MSRKKRMNKSLASIAQLEPKDAQTLATAFENSNFYTIDSNIFPVMYACKGGDLVIATPRCGYLDISLVNVPAFIKELTEIYDLLISRQEMRLKGA